METLPEKARCNWVNHNPLMVAYHDQEWGEPLHDDQKLFEFLILEGVQAGLSWETVLNKRESYRRAFDGFDPSLVAAYDITKIAELLADPTIIRNRAKIEAGVTNAQQFLAVQKEFGSFDRYIWSFVDGQGVKNDTAHYSQLPAYTPASTAMSKDLKKRGFKFVGPTICYAFMQATGMVNDHTNLCYKY